MYSSGCLKAKRGHLSNSNNNMGPLALTPPSTPQSDSSLAINRKDQEHNKQGIYDSLRLFLLFQLLLSMINFKLITSIDCHNHLSIFSHFCANFLDTLISPLTSLPVTSSIDFSYVDVGHLSNEAVDNLEEGELDQYLPQNVTSNYNSYNSNPDLQDQMSSVNAIYAWSNKYISSLQFNPKLKEANNEMSSEPISQLITTTLRPEMDYSIEPYYDQHVTSDLASFSSIFTNTYSPHSDNSHSYPVQWSYD